MDAVRRRGMPEGLDLPVQLPQLNVVAVNELLGEPYGFLVVPTHELDATFDLVVLPENKGAVPLH